jgi:signal transduction histidine kinase
MRLTAVFTVAMTLALAGVGAGTVLRFRHAVDSEIDDTLADRARDLPPPDGSGRLADDADTVVQVLNADGRLEAASPRVGTTPLVTPTQAANARSGPLRFERDALRGLPGRVRLLATAGSNDTVVVVAASVAGRDSAVADLQIELLTALPIVLVIAAAAAYLLAAAALRPVERMRAQASAITADTPARLPVPPGADELTRLGRTLNDMLDRLHTALERERDFVADASHELRTPLALLKTELELALQRPRAPNENEAALRSALEETDRLVALAEDLLLLARTDRPDRPHAQVVALSPLLCRVAARFGPVAAGRSIRVDAPDDLAWVVDARQLERAVGNIVDNALRHGVGPIDITARPTAGHLEVWVRDHGPGFPPEFLPRALHRFSRADTARTGGGTGLGLAIVAAIARRHGGTVRVINQP